MVVASPSETQNLRDLTQGPCLSRLPVTRRGPFRVRSVRGGRPTAHQVIVGVRGQVRADRAGPEGVDVPTAWPRGRAGAGGSGAPAPGGAWELVSTKVFC